MSTVNSQLSLSIVTVNMFKGALAFIFMSALSCTVLFAQVGGQRSFEFMNIPVTAGVASLGGVNVSLPDEEVGLALNNPALAGDTLSGLAAFNYSSYMAGVQALTAVYQRNMDGPWYFGIHHVNYGSIEGYDNTGASLGEYQAGETMMVAGRSHSVRNFTLGVGIKLIYSSITGYTSSALAADIGGLYRHSSKNFTAGLVFKNVGFVLSDYTTTSSSHLPFDIQAGLSFKPEHMPVRFSFTGHHLYTENGISDGVQGMGDRVFRHVVAGAEILLSKNVNFRFGYNHLIRQELRLETKSGGAGFSYGFRFRIKAFEFTYGHGGYHIGGGLHSFMLTANTRMFFKKGKL